MAVFVSIIPCSVSAADDYYKGYTEEEIKLIKEMEETNPEFDLSDGEIVSIEKVVFPVNNRKNDITSYGAIGSKYMEMTLYAQKLENSQYDDFKFQVKADWLSAPFFRMQDAIALAWSDGFSQYTHSCTGYYNSVGYVMGKTSQINSTPEKGVGYSIESSDWYGTSLDYVILTVFAKKANSSGSAVLSAEYAHATAGLGSSFSITFEGEGAISFSTAGLYDVMAADKYFEY